MGACQTLGSEIITNAFDIVAMVAMTPLVTIQTLGLIYTIGENKKNLQEHITIRDEKEEDNDIIEF